MTEKKHFLNMIFVFSFTLFDFSKRAESCLKSKRKDSAVTELVRVGTTLQKFENAFLFLFYTNPSRKRSFLETLSEIA